MKTKIKRSVGISPGIPWAGKLPGGGYKGKTTAIDSAVMKCARWLKKYIGKEVMVRFNSHQESGGAYLDIPYGDSDAGIGASLAYRMDKGALIKTNRIQFNVYVSGKYMAVKPNSGDDHPYFYKNFKTFRAATTLFKKVTKNLT